jgi:NADPH:quinone reductase-like Zn-dependent oxidoreductase
MNVWADIGAVVYMKDNQRTKELGAYAEYALAVESQLGVMPANLGWMEAGSLPKVALTSFKALVWYAGGEIGGTTNTWIAGKTVLVLGGSGGTGTAGIQLAKAMGAAKVLTTAGAGNAAYCMSIGADEVFDYHTQNWWDPALVADDSVDVVYDCVGQAGSGDRAMAKLRDGGYYVTIAGGEGSKPRPGRHQAGVSHWHFPLSQSSSHTNLRSPCAEQVSSTPTRTSTTCNCSTRSRISAALTDCACRTWTCSHWHSPQMRSHI